MRKVFVYLLTLTVLAIKVSEARLSAPSSNQAIVASWYGGVHHGRTTANGEIFDMYALTAAHKDLPFGARLRVTDVATGRSVIVRINDRGPYLGQRALDLSFGAARELGIVRRGLAEVRYSLLSPEPRTSTRSRDRD